MQEDSNQSVHSGNVVPSGVTPQTTLTGQAVCSSPAERTLSLSTPNTQTQHPIHPKHHHPLFRLIARLSLLLFGLLVSMEVKGEWGKTPDDYLTVQCGEWAQMISDGQGGVWIYSTDMATFDRRTIVQHVDRKGNISFPGSIFIFENIGDQIPQAVATDNGDIIVVGMAGYYKYPPDSLWCYNLVAQRIDRQGNRLWGPNGKNLTNGTGMVWLIGMDMDGSGGGVLVGAGSDTPGSYVMGNPFAQRFTSEGEILWDEKGTHLGWESIDWDPRLSLCAIKGDGSGGIFVAQNGSNADTARIFFQYVSRDGVAMWDSANYTEVVNAKWIYPLSAVPRSDNTVLLGYGRKFYQSGEKTRAGCLWIDSQGNPIWKYESTSGRRSLSYGDLMDPIVNRIGDRNYLAWADSATGVLMNCISNDGTLLWDEPKSIKSNYEENEKFNRLSSITSGNSIIYSWTVYSKNRNETIPTQGLYGQKINMDGDGQWNQGEDLLISTNLFGEQLITDSKGGGIFTTFYRYKCGLQLVNQEGQLGIVLEGITGDPPVNQLSVPLSLTLYPQPANNYLKVHISKNAVWNNVDCLIYDITGRLVSSSEVEISREHEFIIDMTNLKSGNYFLLVQSPQGIIRRSFVVLR